MVSCRQFNRALKALAELTPALVEIAEASVVELHRGNDGMPYFHIVHLGTGEFQAIEGQLVQFGSIAHQDNAGDQ
jgi:hypothetical protein